tara:strand:- start:320 stop:1390 length:1071 start_codon:yes stop_codon:yes gene_type:complete
MGIVSEVLPVFSKKPLFGYTTVVLAGAIIAVMGWMVWSHHMFTVGLGPVANAVFTITTMLIAVPTGIKVFNWIGTIWGGSIRINTPMAFSLGFIAMFLIGGISGVMHAVSASDAQQQDTYFIPAHIHYVLFGGAIMALTSGIYYWFPKFSGKMFDEKMGMLHFWLMMIGQNVTFFPMHFVGLDGMPRRIYTYAEGMGWDLWNLVATLGVFILIAGFLVFILNMVKSWKSGPDAPGDPWDGRTLEWSIPSPPPEYNFSEIPVVKSLDDWWNTKQGGNGKAVPVSGGSGDEEHDIHLPQPSYWPLVTAIGLFIAAYGVVFNQLVVPWAISIIGTFIGFVGVYAWSLEPVNDPDEDSAH